jgi:hypothetical protein
MESFFSCLKFLIFAQSLTTLLIRKNLEQKLERKSFQSPWLLLTWRLYQCLASLVKEKGKSFHLKISSDMPSMCRPAHRPISATNHAPPQKSQVQNLHSINQPKPCGYYKPVAAAAPSSLRLYDPSRWRSRWPFPVPKAAVAALPLPATAPSPSHRPAALRPPHRGSRRPSSAPLPTHLADPSGDAVDGGAWWLPHPASSEQCQIVNLARATKHGLMMARVSRAVSVVRGMHGTAPGVKAPHF